MKKICSIIVSVAILIACKNNKTETNALNVYTINGTAKGIETGEVYIQILNKNEMKVDTIKIEKGKFLFKSKIENPQMAIMILNSGNAQMNAKNTQFFFVEPNINMVVTIDTTAKERFVISGSKTTDELKLFKQKYFSAIEEKEKASFENINPATLSKEAMDSLMKKYDALQQEKKEVVLNYVKANKTSFVGAGYAYFIGMQEQEMDTKFLENIYVNIDDKIKKSFYGVEFKKNIDTTSKTDIGATTPDFTANDTNDKPIKLSNFYKEKKFVLIDFWASWCGPCRKENPNVVKAYSQYHTKGFEIIGVSLDEDKNDWLAAIKKDNLTWQHVSELKKWENCNVANLYNITGIPTNFLIDGTGKIVAKNLRGEELESKLNELLK